MALHILKECHWFEYHLTMDATGIEQMQFAVTTPYGKADVTDIQSRLVGSNGQNVTVFYTISERFPAIPHPPLRYVTDGRAGGFPLYVCN